MPGFLKSIIVLALVAIVANLQLSAIAAADGLNAKGPINAAIGRTTAPEINKEPESDFTPLSLLHDSLWQRLSNNFELSSIDNARVDEQIQFLVSGIHSLRNSLTDAAPYLYHIAQELERADLPMDLALVPLIESAFNPIARSSQSAVGIWQFIPSTAQFYGLSTHKKYDQRKDVVMSTKAAVRFLTDLERTFDGDWLLALAAYNTGPGNLRDAMRRARATDKEPDFWNLSLSKETSNYVPRLIAATKIVSNPEAYGLDLPPLPNSKQIESIAVGRRISISQVAELLDLPVEQLAGLNPGLHRGITPSEGPHKLTLPVEATGPLMHQLAKLKRVPLTNSNAELEKFSHYSDGKEKYEFNIDTEIALNEGTTYGSATAKVYRYKTHVVERGDNLWRISKDENVDITTLREWNDLDPDNTIRVGDTIIVPYPDDEANIGPEDAKLMNYLVSANDTLNSIATKFDVQSSDIKRWNKSLWDKSFVQAGQLLKVPYLGH